MDNRIIAMFYHLIYAENYTTTAKIAKEINVSTRTVKSELSKLNEYAIQNGAHIETKRGSGIKLVVDDQRLFQSIKSSLDMISSGSGILHSSLHYRLVQIARIILSQDKYMTLNELSNVLNYSKSTISDELRILNELLLKHSLTLDIKTGLGLRVVGDEFYYRLTMVELLDIHYPRKDFARLDEYSKSVIGDSQRLLKIRADFLNILRSRKYTIFDYLGNRLVHYIILSNYRCLKGYRLNISEKEKEQLMLEPEYNIAKEIYSMLISRYKYPDDDNELLCIVRLLIMWQDPSKESIENQNLTSSYLKAKEATEKTFKNINKKYNFNLSEIKNANEELSLSLYVIIKEIELNIKKYRIIGHHTDKNPVRASFLSNVFAIEAKNVLKEDYKVEINSFSMNKIAISIAAILNSINYDYKKQKAIICSRNGFIGAEIIRDHLLRNFPEAFEELKVMGFYEVRGIKQQDYDFIILNYHEYSYRYDLPYIQVNQFITQEQIKELRCRLYVCGNNLNNIIRDTNISDIRVFENFYYESRKSFLNYIFYRFFDDESRMDSLLAHIIEAEQRGYFKESLCLIIPKTLIGKDVFEIYTFKKPIAWDTYEVKNIIVYSSQFNQNKNQLKLASEILRMLVINPKIIGDLSRNKSKETVILNYLQEEMCSG